MTNLDSILKSRDVTLPKVHLVETMIFPVVVYGCKSWPIKKAEPWRIDAFELWCWKRLLRVTWTARRSNQSMLKGNESWIFIGRTDAEAPTLWPPDAKSRLIRKDRCWERLKAGGEGDDRGWDGWMASLTQWTWVWASSGKWWRTGKAGISSPWGHKESDMTERLNSNNNNNLLTRSQVKEWFEACSSQEGSFFRI